MNMEKELKKLNDDLLKCCRLMQESLSKLSGVLMSYDAQKIREIIDNNRKIEGYCLGFHKYFDGLSRQYQYEGEALDFISSGISVNIELREIANLIAGIAVRLSNSSAGIPEKYKINISQYAKIFQNIVWDSVVSFLRKDLLTARKTVKMGLGLEKICSRMQEDLSETNQAAGPVSNDGSVLLFVVQNVREIAAHAVNIARVIEYESDEVMEQN